MPDRSLDMAIDVPTGVLVLCTTALVAATTAAVVFFLRKDAAARESAMAREREAVLKAFRAEMVAVGRALVRYTVDLHLAHDLPVRAALALALFMASAPRVAYWADTGSSVFGIPGAAALNPAGPKLR